MKHRVATAVVAALALLTPAIAACDAGDEGCTLQYFTANVRVVDGLGEGVEGATVAAENLDNGRTATTTTFADGTTTGIGEVLGRGTVRLVASLGGATSEPVDMHWDKSGCHIVPREDGVVLTLGE